jgi:hypothetical protein
MNDVVGISLSALPQANETTNLNDLAKDMMKEVGSLQSENTSLAANIKQNLGIEGPARSPELSSQDLLRSFEKSAQMSVHMHDNLTKFSILSTTLTSFGNHLNSFLKGQ